MDLLEDFGNGFGDAIDLLEQERKEFGVSGLVERIFGAFESKDENVGRKFGGIGEIVIVVDPEAETIELGDFLRGGHGD